MDEYLKNLPKKRMGAGALFFNAQNQLLIVKPNYHDYWLIPGGVVEKNESPRQACMREVMEEVGLGITAPKFLGVEWSYAPHRGESLQFFFYGGILDDKQIEKIKLPMQELTEYAFVDSKNAMSMVSSNLARRLPKILEAQKNNQAIYFEYKEGQ